MTSLGKKTILIRSFMDGEQTGERTRTQNVYTDGAGKCYVSFLGQKHGREVTLMEDGRYLWEFKVATLPSRTTADFLSELTRRRDG